MSVLNALILAVAMAQPDESLVALNRLQQLRATLQHSLTIAAGASGGTQRPTPFTTSW